MTVAACIKDSSILIVVPNPLKIASATGVLLIPFLFEFKRIGKHRTAKHYNLLKKFNGCGRYIDDLLLINNYDLMKEN